MKTLLLGMGNPILADDAVGVRLAADFKAAVATGWGKTHQRMVETPDGGGRYRESLATFGTPGGQLDILEECAVGGISLLELLRGYQRAIVLDSIQTCDCVPGAWHRFTAAALRETVHLTNIHDANFATALALGRRMRVPVPDDAEIHIFAVEIQDNRTFSERMTPALERAYPRIRSAIFRRLSALSRCR